MHFKRTQPEIPEGVEWADDPGAMAGEEPQPLTDRDGFEFYGTHAEPCLNRQFLPSTFARFLTLNYLKSNGFFPNNLVLIT